MYLVTIEGIDGSGKSTLFERLKECYKRDNVDYVKFPGGYFFNHYRDNLTDEEIEELQQKDKRIIYEWGRNKQLDVLIGDRGEVSQKVYNGTDKTSIESDLVIYLDIDIEEAFKRIDVRGEEDNLGFENKDVLTEKKKRYEEVLEKEYKDKVVRFYIKGNMFEDINGKQKNLQEVVTCIEKELDNLRVNEDEST